MNRHGVIRPDAASAPALGPATESPGALRADVLGSSTRLGPAEAFPAELGSLTLVELQVLHSRVCLQLEDERLAVLEGPHPVTLDRHQELVDALDAHQGSVVVAAGE